MFNRKLVLFCARLDAQAGVVLDVLREFYDYQVVGFYDDNEALLGQTLAGIPVLGRIADFPQKLPDGVDQFFVCTGNNDFREHCYTLIKKNNFTLINVVHPSAVISKSAIIGDGVFVGAHVCVTHNAKIGNGVILNTHAVIEHDNVIEDFANISPNASTAGRVKIKRKAFLGVGVSLIPDVEVGENALVGAGSVVIRNVPDNTKVAGVPARAI